MCLIGGGGAFCIAPVLYLSMARVWVNSRQCWLDQLPAEEQAQYVADKGQQHKHGDSDAKGPDGFDVELPVGDADEQADAGE